MNGKAFNAYKNNSVTTQTPARVVVLLYEGAIRFLKQAVEALEQEKYGEKGRLIVRAIDVISELNSALDLDAGGEIAINLRKLYLFMNAQLVKANLKKDTQMILQVVQLLEELNKSWKEVAA